MCRLASVTCLMCWIVLLGCFSLFAWAPAQAQDLATLNIGATDYDGLPLEGVPFTVQSTVPGSAETSKTVRTDAYGQAEFALSDPAAVATVTLASMDYQAVQPVRTSDAGDRWLMFQLFRSDVERMRLAERAAFARQWAKVVSGRTPPSTGPGDPLPPEAVSAFLEQTRREIPEPLTHPADSPTSPGAFRVSVIDTQGQRIAGQVVYLFCFDPASNAVRPAGAARTDQYGTVYFDRAVPGLIHRAETRSNAGEARSTLLRAKSGAMQRFPALVLRDPFEVLSGFVYNGSVPAPGTMVSTRPRPGSRDLSAITDEAGFFTLAPLPPGEQRFAILGNTSDGPRAATLTLEPGYEEYLIPFHVFPKANGGG